MPIFVFTPLIWTGAAAAGYYAKRLFEGEEVDRLGYWKQPSDDAAIQHIEGLRDDAYKEWAEGIRNDKWCQDKIDRKFVARGGLPRDTRAKLWMKISGGEEKKNLSKTQYSEVKECTGCNRTAVGKDINRTLPRCNLFREPGGKGQQSLETVLLKFSGAYRHGYTQSMNVVTGFFLSAGCTEEQAFWLLDAVVQGHKYSHDYYTDACGDSDGLRQCRDDLCIFDMILNERAPKLMQVFAETVSPCYIVCLQWVLCLFVDYTQTEYSLIILDLYFLEGLPFLYNLALSILITYEEKMSHYVDIQDVIEALRVTLRSQVNLTPLLLDAVTAPNRLTHDSLSKLREMLLHMKMVAKDEEGARRELFSVEKESFNLLKTTVEEGLCCIKVTGAAEA